MTWYAVRTATRQEKRATVDLIDLGFTIYLPCETLTRRLGGEKQDVRRPLFDGYLFIDTTPDHWATVRATQHVHAFVHMLSPSGVTVPAPFPDHVITEIFHRDFAGEFDRTANPTSWKAKRGDQVFIIGGKWGAMNYLATILSVTTSERRALVMLANGFKIDEAIEHLVEAA